MKNQIIYFLLTVPFFSMAQNLYYPPNTGNQWDTISPSSLGYCPKKIDSLYSFLDDQNSKAFILLKDGKIVLEKYFGNFTQDSLWYWASAGKTLTAALVGIAQQENFLKITDSSYRYLGKGWTVSPKESHITIKDQLSMTTGLDDGVPDVDCTYDTCLQYLADPGNRWAYHNAPYTMLDSVIYYATGQSINQYLLSKIKNPIGMNGAYVKLAFNNVYFSNSRSFARFGLLLLGKGKWNGNAILSDTNYFNEMVNSSQSLNNSYGYLTWLNGKSSFMIPGSQLVIPGSLNADAPSDMYAALGKNGQLINIVPSQNLVWVRMGNAPGSGGGLISPILNNNIWKKINDLVCVPGVEENRTNIDIKIYPNPAFDKIHVDLPEHTGKVHFSILEINGALLSQGELDYSNDIYLTGVKEGFYVLKLYGEKWNVIKKFAVSTEP